MRIGLCKDFRYRLTRVYGITFTLLLFLVSCAAPKSYMIQSAQRLEIVGERPPLDEDLAALVPAGLQQATWVNLKELKLSPLWPTLKMLFEAHFEGPLSKSFILDVLSGADELLSVSGHRTPGEGDNFVALLKGDLNAPALISKLSRQPKFSSVEIDRFPGAKNGPFIIYAITKQTLVVTTAELVEDCVALTARQGESLRTQEGFSMLHTPSYGGFVSHYIRGNSQLNMRNFNGTPLARYRWPQKITRLDTSVKISDTISLEATSQMESESDAARVKRDIDKEVNAITSNALIALMGVKPLLRKLKINTQNKNVLINMVLSPADIAKIVKLVEPIMQIREMLN